MGNINFDRHIINDRIRNMAGSVINGRFRHGQTPIAIRVELREYGDTGLYRNYWKVDMSDGELYTKCIHQKLIEKDMTLDKEYPIERKVPERSSTRVNIKHIMATERKRFHVYSRITGLLVSCAWKLWSPATELVVWLLVKNKYGEIVHVPAVTFDGVEVF